MPFPIIWMMLEDTKAYKPIIWMMLEVKSANLTHHMDDVRGKAAWLIPSYG